MKKVVLVTLAVLVCGVFAMAQIQNPTSDVLGAHLNYGRGCAACHAPHSGAFGNGINTTDPNTGNIALWGQNVGALFGKTFITGQSEHGSYVLTIPSTWTQSDPVSANTMTCLSCHDGNYAVGAMMKNKVYEQLPPTYGTNPIPTLLGNAYGQVNDYLNDHPVGDNATIGCGGSYNWDCTISANGTIIPGPKMTQFIQDYGFFVSPQPYAAQPTVQCTTCHNQHLMNVVNVTAGRSGCTGGVCSGLPPGNYATMFFIRGPYNPATTTLGANQTAQFCRECHGGESNEMNGGNLPTIF
jgi:cytochrome c553